MPEVIFLPSGLTVDALEGQKILAIARKAKLNIRFGCAAAQCGTCAVRVSSTHQTSPTALLLSQMRENEKELLSKMKLPIDGSVRLSCQAKTIETSCIIDLDFQSKYDPTTGILEKS